MKIKKIFSNDRFTSTIAISLIVESFLVFPLYNFVKPLLSNSIDNEIKTLMTIVLFMIGIGSILLNLIVNKKKSGDSVVQTIIKRFSINVLNTLSLLVVVLNFLITFTISMRTYYFLLGYLFCALLNIVSIAYDCIDFLYEAVLKHTHTAENKFSIIASTISLLIAIVALLI